MNNAITSFFRNETPDNSGRLLAEILAWGDDKLEWTHDYIQWLFPMRISSPVNPDAPTVDDAAVAAFAADPRLRAALASAFNRMVKFYGFEVKARGSTMRIVRSADWPKCSANWLSRRNHNMLRITRIITSLRLLGLDRHAQAFFAALEALYTSDEGDAIGTTTFEFWKEAAES
jgi:Opioid growth factor receptor (OGFr) conserved region